MHCGKISAVFLFGFWNYLQFQSGNVEGFALLEKRNVSGTLKEASNPDHLDTHLPLNEELRNYINQEVPPRNHRRVKRGPFRKEEGAVDEDQKKPMTPKEEKKAHRMKKSKRRMTAITIFYCVFCVFISIGVVAVNILKTVVYKCEKALI